MPRALVWFRSDLRTQDHPALSAARARSDRGVVGVFVVSNEQWLEHDWAPVKVDLIRRTLTELRGDLERLRIPLRIVYAPRFGDVPRALLTLADSLGCDELHHGAEYEVDERKRDERVRAAFEGDGRRVFEHTTKVLAAPGSVRTGQGSYYTVFSPFKKSLLKDWDERDMPVPEGTVTPCEELVCESDEIPQAIDGFEGPGNASWAELWPAGERSALARLDRFRSDRVRRYKDDRDAPGLDATSVLSPYLTLGMVSPLRCLHEAQAADAGPGREAWISEVIWREFYQHVLVGFPRVCMEQSFRPEYDAFEWADDHESLEAWKQGRTGVPIVDAAMRQLRETGWMHNRCRMITAMFLSKNLLIDWREGERWFMRNLVDGDLGSNNGGWQWSSSTGTDAAPYFRIFNPVSQSQKHDPDGGYIRRFVPELKELAGESIHMPSPTPPGYPSPIVDLKSSRERAIESFKTHRSDAS